MTPVTVLSATCVALFFAVLSGVILAIVELKETPRLGKCLGLMIAGATTLALPTEIAALLSRLELHIPGGLAAVYALFVAVALLSGVAAREIIPAIDNIVGVTPGGKACRRR